MAEEMLDKVRDALDGQIVCSLPIASISMGPRLRSMIQDFEGQKMAELLATVLLSVTSVS